MIKNKEWYEKWWGTLIIILGVLIIFIIFFNIDFVNHNSNNTLKQNNTSVSKKFTCPSGDYFDSGNPTNDLFNCSDIQRMLDLNKSLSRDYVDCSDPNNYSYESVSFNISSTCEKDDSIILSDDCYKEGGILKPDVVSNVYPSLNEYYFKSLSLKIINLGCTKINLDNYYVIYGLYQNSVLLDIKAENIPSYLLDDYKILYPKQFMLNPLYFGDSKLGTAIKLNNPNNLTFKLCVINKEKHTIVSCDKANFNLEYKKYN